MATASRSEMYSGFFPLSVISTFTFQNAALSVTQCRKQALEKTADVGCACVGSVAMVLSTGACARGSAARERAGQRPRSARVFQRAPKDRARPGDGERDNREGMCTL